MKSSSRLLLAAALPLASHLHAAVLSTFDTGVDGWYTADVSGPNWTPTGSTGSATWNAAGYIETTDTLGYTAFAAPAKFLGNMSAYYGGALSYDLGDALNDLDAWPNAILYGGGNTLTYVTLPPATTGFTSYKIPLAPGNWLWNNGAAASAAQIQSVLVDLDGLYFHADWNTGEDRSRLDNVRLEAVPEPAAGAALAALGLLGYAFRRRVG